MGGWFRKEIKEVADLKGLKMRIGGFAGQMLQKLGVVPQQIAGGDIYPALEKGTIDAAEWVGPYDDEKLGFYKVAKYYYYPGWWEGGTDAAHFMSTWRSGTQLPKSYQAIARRPRAGRATSRMPARYDARNPAALKRLVAAGAQLRPFPQADHGGLPTRPRNEVYAEISAEERGLQEDLGRSWRFRNDEYLWWQVAEYTYDTFMIRDRARAPDPARKRRKYEARGPRPRAFFFAHLRIVP